MLYIYHFTLNLVSYITCDAWLNYSKGVYPQNDGSLAIVDFDASKGFVDLWVHLTFAIFAIFDVKRTTKIT